MHNTAPTMEGEKGHLALQVQTNAYIQIEK